MLRIKNSPNKWKKWITLDHSLSSKFFNSLHRGRYSFSELREFTKATTLTVGYVITSWILLPYLLTFPKVKITGEYCLSFLRQLRRYKNPSNCTLTFLPLSSIILHDRWENYRSFTDKIFKKWFNFITQFLTTAHGTIANVKFRIPMRKFNIPTKLVKLTNIWSQIKSAESL